MRDHPFDFLPPDEQLDRLYLEGLPSLVLGLPGNQSRHHLRLRTHLEIARRKGNPNPQIMGSQQHSPQQSRRMRCELAEEHRGKETEAAEAEIKTEEATRIPVAQCRTPTRVAVRVQGNGGRHGELFGECK